ncbi:hypothetical protein EYF80_026590 [Liparis tanakae]|uniref:Secreted protein n=1 Tax=Liparis tanakae TaxID=230148 RepID=A0A4Z2HBJ0_9TELE|nr:hypothetical protein EYF80_026590 [Liparis tanakae]
MRVSSASLNRRLPLFSLLAASFSSLQAEWYDFFVISICGGQNKRYRAGRLSVDFTSMWSSLTFSASVHRAAHACSNVPYRGPEGADI